MKTWVITVQTETGVRTKEVKAVDVLTALYGSGVALPKIVGINLKPEELHE